jgi:hypothetical protein
MKAMLEAALEYGAAGYEVFPLRGKLPAIPSPHPPEARCKSECGQDGHGVLDATTDLAKIEAWWTHRPTANIGVRVPKRLMVLDVDPRHDGHETLAELLKKHGQLPATRISVSGRGDGGCHLWFRHPGVPVSSKRLGAGLDLKTHSGYVVVPPSIHPDSRRPYIWIDPSQDAGSLPPWLRGLLVEPHTIPRSKAREALSGPTLADRLSWSEILPSDWHCLDPDPDRDGARWRHPNATNKISATVRNGCLFVYSTGTPFEVTETGTPHGYTKLRAYALLYHRGDCKAAHRSLGGGPSE